MKKSRYFCFVFALWLTLFAVFSPLSYATEADSLSGTFSYDYIDVLQSSLRDEYISNGYGDTVVTNGDDFSFFFQVPHKSYSTSVASRYPVLIFSCPVTGTAGNSFSLTVSGVNVDLEISQASNGNVALEKSIQNADFICNTVKVTYSDGTFELFKDYDLVTDGNGLTFSYSVDEVVTDITCVEFNAFFNIGTLFNDYGSSYNYFVTVSSSNCKITQSTALTDQGLIEGIIEWLKSILAAITELPDKIGEWINKVITAITELPDKILEGIKGLFVPTEEDMTEIKDKFDLLMQERFGALYQAGSIISDFAQNFTFQGTQATIYVPYVGVPLADGYFEFGDFEVQILPDGFDELYSFLHMGIAIICTLAFVVMLRNKFNKIVGDHT